MHEDIETLSAYLDGELPAGETERVESHLAACAECAGRRDALKGAARMIASLEASQPTGAESQAIRRAILEGTGLAPARQRRSWWPRVALGAGALAAVVAGIGGYAALRPPPPTVASGRPKAASSGTAAVFASEDEVRTSVPRDPEVAAGLHRFRVSDVGGRQPGALRDLAAAPAAEAPASASSIQQAPSAPPAARQATGATAPVLVRPVGDCLASTLKSQPYPMMPLEARAALYKGEPVWLLVYAWTTSADESAPLDRLQIWLVDRADCAPRFQYSQFRPGTS